MICTPGWLAPAARAGALYWDGNGAADGAGVTPAGTWGTNNSWSNSAAGTVAPTGAWSAGSSAVFSAGTDAIGTFTVSVSGAQTAAAVSFEEGSVTLSGGTLNLIGGGTIDFPAAATAATITSAITGTAGLSVSGGGRLTIGGGTNNSYTGGTTVNEGATLRLAANGSAGNSAGAVNLVGGTLDLNGFNQTIGALTFGDGASTTAATVSGPGTLTIGEGITFNGAPFGGTPPAVIGSNVTLTSSTHTVANAGTTFSSGILYDVLLAGQLGGSGGLTKAGSGGFNAVLTHANNTYTGPTIVNSGVLFLAANNALSAQTAVTVNAGGLLSLAPTAAQDGVSPGNYNQTIGSLAGAGGVSLGSATLSVGSDNTSTTFSGQINDDDGNIVKVGTATLTLSGSLSYTGATTVSAGKLTLGTNLLNGSSVTVTGGRLELTPAQTRLLRTPILSVNTTSGGGKIDLQDNKIITANAVGTLSGSSYSGITGLIQSGRNGGPTGTKWAGNGIMTSQTAATTGSLTSIGVASGAQVNGIAATDTAAWAGVIVSGTDTLVMYTYGGDANLDGTINVDDYGHIDFNIPLGTSGWYNGDFNYDGKINVDDYGIIDFNVGIQGAPFATTTEAVAATEFRETGGARVASPSVPEPSAGAMIAATLAMTARKRRRSTRA